jgi:DNA-binding transcriptional LysR family regulator
MEINAKTLRVLCAVFDTGSLQAASLRVALSPSAISRIVSAAEKGLGTILFDRSERRMAPTSEGRSFHARAREALLLLDDVAGFGRRIKAGSHPPLRVAALSRHAQTIVAPAIAAALKADPRVGPIAFDMHAQRDFGFSRLARPFDVGFGNLVAPQEELESVLLAQSALVASMPPGHPLAGREAVTVEEIVPNALVTLSRDTIVGMIVREFLGSEAQLHIVAEVSHTYLALDLVAAGIGIHITDALAASHARRRGCHLARLLPEKAVSLLAFWPRRSGLSDRAAALVSAFRDTIVANGGTVCPSVATPL